MLHYGKLSKLALLKNFDRDTINAKKLFFSYKRCDSVTTNMLLVLGSPSFDTLLHNCNLRFTASLSNCKKLHSLTHIVMLCFR